jgi:DNA-binding response OmpR family regulator
MLPKISGLEVCQRLRHAGVETPVIMLTARGAASDAAFGLKLGADDYIPKPFDVGELLARVEAVLRRAKHPQAGPEVVSIGDVTLYLRRLRATKKGKPLDLSPAEFELLQFLIAHAGETVTREQCSITFGANTLRSTHARSTRTLRVCDTSSKPIPRTRSI